MGRSLIPTSSFMRSLAQDATANTLAISAAAMLPLMAMVGGGVDASRYYMAESRLQAACDAGALAARRAMDNDNFSNEHKTVGLNFFDNNYKEGMFGLEELDRNYNATNDGEVTGTATGNLPSTIMGAFGYDNYPISVSCQADINIANTDIMLVLDVTGSMAWKPDGTDCGTDSNGWIECSNSRIGALRTSVLNFYDTIDAASSSSAQIRYGIVPYSQQVNVGHLLDTSWLKTEHEYESRETIRTFDFDNPIIQSVDAVRTGGQISGTYVDSGDNDTYNGILPTYNDCVDIAFNNPPGNGEYHSYDPNGLTEVSSSGYNPRTVVYEGPARYKSLEFRSGTWYGSTNSTNRRCEIFYDVYTWEAESTLTIVEEYPYTWEYRYGKVPWPISDVYSTGQVSLPTGQDMEEVTHTWDGCVEMPDTPNDTGDYSPIPSDAYDLQIDLVPSQEEEKWAPMLPTVNFQRLNSSREPVERDVYTKSNFINPGNSCPKQALKLTETTRYDLENYLKKSNGFRADGATYLDVGMIWGAKMISPDGIFASENTAAANGTSISRHIVFMTDGEASPNVYNASAYGAEFWARRITTNGEYDTALDRHEARLQAACLAARNKNITVWVVAFGETFLNSSGQPEVPDNLRSCATPGRAYVARNEAALDTAFRDIAEKIADLRLTQ